MARYLHLDTRAPGDLRANIRQPGRRGRGHLGRSFEEIEAEALGRRRERRQQRGFAGLETPGAKRPGRGAPVEVGARVGLADDGFSGPSWLEDRDRSLAAIFVWQQDQ